MKIHQIPAYKFDKTPGILRVAAYCRVSTKYEEQDTSYQFQQEFYRKYITSHPNWFFVGIYADQASGRCNKKMLEFQRLMEDCRGRRIDLIFVKSISRMGRNTLEFLQSLNEIKELGVDVFFEVENLHLRDRNAMLMLTLYAGLAQDESENMSMNIAWGIRQRFADGTSKFLTRPCYGYYKDKQGNLVIDEAKAKVVRDIFDWHNRGYSLRDISKRLYQAGIVSPSGKEHWGPETLRKILNNEKYYGNVLLQKTFVADFFRGKQSPNQGQLSRYFIEDCHEAIIKE